MGNGSSVSREHEEWRRLTDAAAKREKELQETINKLQESERERRLLIEMLTSNLEDTKKKLIVSDSKVRQLENRLHEERLTTAHGVKKIGELDQEKRRLMKDLESEKAAREEALSKVSVLELQINAAMQDLDSERRRLRGARERLKLQQQEQLKSMQRTLEDEENGVVSGASGREKQLTEEHSNNDVKARMATTVQKHDDRDQIQVSSNEASVFEKHDPDKKCEEHRNMKEVDQVQTSANEASVTEKHPSDITSEECRNAHETDQVQTSTNEDSVTEKHHSDIRSEESQKTHETDQVKTSTNEASSTEKSHSDIRSEECQNTHEEDQIQSSINEGRVTSKNDSDVRGEQRQNTHEFNCADHDHDVRGGFGSNSDVGTETSMIKGDAGSTEPVLKTESCRDRSEQNIDLNGSVPLDMDTRQFDEGINAQETEEHAQRPDHKVLHLLLPCSPIETDRPLMFNDVM
ncbi:myosin-11-like [Arachis ipaensis]|uniref:myosin-11-like n=1 Tax=Arachis ipaensis TaxID=130454 RepID=UPI0007AEEC71|nr:myosin-11-like [Arachis ipaensis]